MSKKPNESNQIISLPKSGGAIKGIGETFQPNLFSGTGNFSIPIATSPGRNGFGPQLSLQYSTGNGNGPFGLVWNLSIPRITRKTEKGLPKYTDEDVFVMSGAEDLVPVLNGEIDRPTSEYTITTYRPRTEGLFARIEKWEKNESDIHWRAITKENVTSIYGKNDAARIVDPKKPHHIFEWLLEETFDAKGNHILYEYVKEQPDLNISTIFEQNREYNQTYIRRIMYGNKPNNGEASERNYVFEVLFDYEDLPETPDIPFIRTNFPEKTSSEEWPVRDDTFSSFRAGFEIRTLRRCNRILMLHHFTELEGAPLVKSTDFTYDHNKDTGISMLKSATVRGYRKEGDIYRYKDMPPVSFEYSEFKPQEQRYQSITAEGNDLPPRALNNPDFALVDIFGNGLPDILNTTDTGYYFWQNQGDGHIDCRHPQHTMPGGLVLSSPNVTFGDMGGDGLVDLVVEAPQMSGFFEATPDGNWKPFKRFATMPSFSLTDPNLRLVDLTGDGLSDVLITQDHHFLWFQCKGEEGYDGPHLAERTHDLNDIFFNDPFGRVRLADVTGDGLNDIVLIHSGRVDYWPNLGYGRFGKRITMANAPHFDYNFDPKRLFLADLDGTGCADLVYVDFDSVHFWFNQSGNGWSEKQTIQGTPYVTDMSSVQFADFYGTGTATLVWSYDYNFQPEGNYKVLDFCGGVKPHLLNEMSNNMGATTKVKYAPSTKFYLEDKKEGNPWVTNLPFPVQVLEKTEVIDHISKTKLVTTYKYHHGYFNGKEREFRGFGCVEQFDTEEFETFNQSSLHEGEDLFVNNQKAYHVPPVHTKTWFHTGVYFDENLPSANGQYYDKKDMMTAYSEEFYKKDQKAFKFDDNEIGETIALHEAYRALRGSVLRTEVYGLDGSAEEEHPYMVTESRYCVKVLQDAYWSQDGRYYHGVFLPIQKETVSYHYERNPEDPRIAHQLTLRVDEYGNVTDSASIAYPRRFTAEYIEQTKIKAIYTHNKFIKKFDDPGFYYVGVPYETRIFEVHGLGWEWDPDDDGFFKPLIRSDFDPIKGNENFEPFDFKPPENLGTLKKRLVDWKRTYFRKDINPDQLDDVLNPPVHCLDLGEIESFGLPYESYQAAFTTTILGEIYGGRLDTNVLSSKGGYHEEEGEEGYWWIPSGRQSFDPDKFLMTKQTQDPFGEQTTIEFDEYGLLMVSVEDPFHNKTTAINDYRVLQPKKLTDPNQTSTEVAFDTLGMVVGTAVMGIDKDDGIVGDSLDEFVEYLYEFMEDPDETIIRDHIDHPLTNPHDILKNATTILVYDLNRFKEDEKPNVVYTLARETHAHSPGGAETNIQHSFVYSDGFGREVQTKIQAEPEPVERGADTSPRWVGTGTKIYNNKGKPVQEFEPFFSGTHEYEVKPPNGVSPIIFFDPLERVVCTLHPNHTYEKVVFDPWMQETWDTSDTIHPEHRYDPQAPELQPDYTYDPADDPDIGHYFHELNHEEYLPTWYELRLDPDKAKEKWPDFGENGTSIPENDNIRKKEKSAAEKAAKHAATPSTAYLDVLGRPFLTVTDNGKDQDGKDLFYETRVKLDIEGNDLIIQDSFKRDAFEHDFDIAGRKLHINSIDAGSKIIFPNAANNPVYAWDASGHEIHTEYDKLQRPEKVWVTYNGNRRLVNKTIYGDDLPDSERLHRVGRIYKQYDEAGLLTFDYDFKGNPVIKTRKIIEDSNNISDFNNEGNLIFKLDWSTHDDNILDNSREFTTEQEFDALNRVIRIKYPDDTQVKYKYNEANFLECIKVDGEDYVRNINYNEKGQRMLIRYGNDVKTEYDYDPETFRLTNLWTKTNDDKFIQDLAYYYDTAGNITSIVDDAKNPGHRPHTLDSILEHSRTYEYDPLYRLTHAEGRESKNAPSPLDCNAGIPADPTDTRSYSRSYVYDEAGNIRSISHKAPPGASPVSAWNKEFTYVSGGDPGTEDTIPLNNRLREVNVGSGTKSFSFDNNGNMTSIAGTQHFFWDYADRMGGATNSTASDFCNTSMQARYFYDAGGMRVMKVVTCGSVTKTWVYIDGIYEEYKKESNSGLKEHKTYKHIMDDKNRIAIIKHIEVQTEADPEPNVLYHHGDHLGSSQVVTNGDGDFHNQEEYYPYGETSFGSYEKKRYRYSGKERDEETGLYYYGARYYAPWLGRWMSCDPASIIDGMNLFVYVRNNPIRRIDINGMESEFAISGTKDDKLNEKSTPKEISTFVYRQTGGTLHNPDVKNDKWVGDHWDLGPDAWIEHHSPESQPESEPEMKSIAKSDEGFWKSIVSGKEEASFLESIIPVIGSVKNANYHFNHENWIRGTGYTALAISDVFLFRSLCTGAFRLVKRGVVSLRGIGQTFLRELNPFRGTGSKTKLITKLKRFFVQDRTTYQADASVIYRTLKEHFKVSTRGGEKSMFEMHHWLIQNSWYAGGNAINNAFLRNWLQKLGNAGWNIIPIPSTINYALGRSKLATISFAQKFMSLLYAEFNYTTKEFLNLFHGITE